MTRTEIQRALEMRRGDVKREELRERVVRVTAAGEQADSLKGPLTSTSTSSATALWSQTLQTAALRTTLARLQLKCGLAVWARLSLGTVLRLVRSNLYLGDR